MLYDPPQRWRYNLLSGGTFLVPVKVSVIKVFRFSFPAHPVRDRTQNSLHHGEVLPVVVRLQNSRRLERTEGDYLSEPARRSARPGRSRARAQKPSRVSKLANWLIDWLARLLAGWVDGTKEERNGFSVTGFGSSEFGK